MIAGRSEQSAHDWIQSFEICLDKIFSFRLKESINAISVDGTSGTVLPVSPDGEALANALMHNDMRASEEAKLCQNVFDGECSPTFALPKILWMQKNLPLPDNTLFLHSSDFIFAWLAGTVEVPTDFTNAMKTGVDLENENWRQDEMIDSLHLPKIIPPGQSFGVVCRSHRKKWGIDQEVILVSGATDSNAAFYASGACNLGDWASTIGTTLAVKGLSAEKITDQGGRIYCHKHPDGIWLPGGASNAGAEIIRQKFSGREQHIEELLKKSDLSVKGLLYPSVRLGERLPVANKEFKPFQTIEDSTDELLYLACLEGIAYTERMIFDLLQQLGANTGGSLFAMGGTTQSILGLQIRADVQQKCIHIPAHPNSAFGAAILAAAGYRNQTVGETSKAMVKVVKEIEPRLNFEDYHENKYLGFQDICLSNS
jgi:sugar (pentulose or hexulose) kinase